MSFERWLRFYKAVVAHRDSEDVLQVQFEHVVRYPDRIEKQIAGFAGWESEKPFRDFHRSLRPEIETTALNGLRPLDETSIGRWKQSHHQPRVKAILKHFPEMANYRRNLGYPAESLPIVHCDLNDKRRHEVQPEKTDTQ